VDKAIFKKSFISQVLYYSTATLLGKTSPVIAAAVVVDEPQLAINTVALTANRNNLKLVI